MGAENQTQDLWKNNKAFLTAAPPLYLQNVVIFGLFGFVTRGLCTPSCPETHYVDQTSLKLRAPRFFCLCLLGQKIKELTIMPSS